MFKVIIFPLLFVVVLSAPAPGSKSDPKSEPVAAPMANPKPDANPEPKPDIILEPYIIDHDDIELVHDVIHEDIAEPVIHSSYVVPVYYTYSAPYIVV